MVKTQELVPDKAQVIGSVPSCPQEIHLKPQKRITYIIWKFLLAILKLKLKKVVNINFSTVFYLTPISLQC
jgi:hypothetical protein